VIVRKGSWHYRLFVYGKGSAPINFWGEPEPISVCRYFGYIFPLALIRGLLDGFVWLLDHTFGVVVMKFVDLVEKAKFSLKCPFGNITLVERDARKNDLQGSRVESGN
jgi:hypothetical protein